MISLQSSKSILIPIRKIYKILKRELKKIRLKILLIEN